MLVRYCYYYSNATSSCTLISAQTINNRICVLLTTAASTVLPFITSTDTLRCDTDSNYRLTDQVQVYNNLVSSFPLRHIDCFLLSCVIIIIVTVITKFRLSYYGSEADNNLNCIKS